MTKLLSLTDAQITDGRLRARQQQRRFRIRVEGITAHAKIESAEQFLGLLRLLRENRHFCHAVVRIERLQATLREKRGVGLPVPEEVWQNPEPSLVVCWGHASVIAFEGGIASLVGGTGGTPTPGVSEDLLNALALKAKLQSRPVD